MLLLFYRQRNRWSLPHDILPTPTIMPLSHFSPLILQSPHPPPNSTPWALNPTPQPSQPKQRRRSSPSITKPPRMSHRSAVLPVSEQLTPLQARLPTRFRDRHWQLAYSTMMHGVSLQTLYANVAGNDPVVCVIRDGDGGVFGWYSSVGWKKGEVGYYGNGEGFVFRKGKQDWDVWTWSRKNRLFQWGEGGKRMVVGGGAAGGAVVVDSDLFMGRSEPCDTFASERLASKQDFEVIVMEAWRLVPAYKLQMANE